MKFGRKRPANPPRYYLHRYTNAALPAPPATVDCSPAAAPAIANIMKNDVLGCCVISGGYHFLAAITGGAGDLFNATDAQVVHDYSAACGYPPDEGCDEQATLQYWMSTGFADKSKLAGFIGIDATNPTQLKQSVYLFGGVIFGLELPDAYTNPMPQQSGFVWDVAGAPNPRQGHCIVAIGYNAQGLIVATWGMTGILTWAAAAKYCVTKAGGEAYAAIDQDILIKAQAKTPQGFDWPTLIADFNEMGGNIPAPAPAPSPTPIPNPPEPIPPMPTPPAPVPPLIPYQTAATVQQFVDTDFTLLETVFPQYSAIIAEMKQVDDSFVGPLVDGWIASTINSWTGAQPPV